MAPDAPAHVIRESYRALAREHHPDRRAINEAIGPTEDAADAMARINEAYHVLGDPGRRALYDRSLRSTAPPPAPRRSRGARREDDLGDADDLDDLDEFDEWFRRKRRANPFDPDGPARFPWRLVLLLGVLGSVLVLISSAFTEAPADEAPDGILQTGSCVTIEANGDAREIACTGDDNDIVVGGFVPVGATCPVGLSPHRDRLGLGVACIRP